MTNPSINLVVLLTIATAASLILISAQSENNVTLNKTIQNTTIPIEPSSNLLDEAFVDESESEIGTTDKFDVNIPENQSTVVQENVTLIDATQNNIITNNLSSNLTSLNKSVDTSLEKYIFASYNIPVQASNGTVFTVGGDGNTKERAFEVGMPAKPLAKDASQLGYIIQATPHGTV